MIGIVLGSFILFVLIMVWTDRCNRKTYEFFRKQINKGNERKYVSSSTFIKQYLKVMF